MSFTVWFRLWVRSFFKLLTLGSKKRKTEAQRKREHDRRMKAKHSGPKTFRIKKKRARRRRSLHAWFEKVVLSLIDFTALSLGILLLPLGLFDWRHRSIKVKKAAKKNTTQRSASPKSTIHTQLPKTAPVSHKASSTEVKIEEEKSTQTTTPTPKEKSSVEAKTVSISSTTSKVATLEDVQNIPAVVKKEIPVELNGNEPKSKPKHESDRYIRKRMIIVGSPYCDRTVLDSLEVGAYIDLVVEPTNPCNKDAIMLTHNGEKIGYIAKEDLPAFVTCMRLGRKVYGVITDIITESSTTKYEYETWFDSNK